MSSSGQNSNSSASKRKATPRKATPRKRTAAAVPASKPQKRTAQAKPAGSTRVSAKTSKAAKTSKTPVVKPAKAPKAATRRDQKPARSGKGMALPQLPLGKAHKIPATPSAAAPKAKGALGETLPQTQRFVKRQERRAARQKEQAAGAGWLTLVRTGIVAVVAIAALLVTLFLVLRVTPLFTITSIEADPTTHITAQDIANLTKLDANATLLNYNASELEASLKKNPWVKSVSFTAEFPSTLKITIEEREAFAICVATTSDKAWYLSMQGTWIEPVSLTAAGDTTLAAAALEKAGQEGLVLIQNLSSMSPVAGEETDDAAILACLTFEDELSESLRSQIVSYSAASSEAISCTLSSGVEISLGAATNIASKETVITSLLEEYPGQLTYINVRIPSKPSYRKIASDSVQAGSGVITQQEEQS